MENNANNRLKVTSLLDQFTIEVQGGGWKITTFLLSF